VRVDKNLDVPHPTTFEHIADDIDARYVEKIRVERAKSKRVNAYP
jgi:hypothetical protein